MTDNQRVAIDRLNQYRDARHVIDMQRNRIEELETRCNKMTRDPASIMQRKRNQDGSFTLVPVVVKTNHHINGAEDMIAQLMDMRSLYWQKCVDAEKLCMDIEREISEYCSGVHARILSMYYLYNKSLEFIAVKETFSYRHIKRLKWKALEEFGKRCPLVSP